MNDWMTFFSAIGGALVGGSIAGYFSLRATKQAHANAQDLDQKKQKQLITGLLQAIHDEIETIWERYNETMGVQVDALKENDPLLMYYPLTQDFFTVFNANGFLIGHIDDHDLRKEIISVYVLAKGLVDSYKLNNDLLMRYEHWTLLHQETQMDLHQQHAEGYRLSMIDYAKKLRAQHNILKDKISHLLRAFHKRGTLFDRPDSH